MASNALCLCGILIEPHTLTSQNCKYAPHTKHMIAKPCRSQDPY
jgi:hypothetical protein